MYDPLNPDLTTYTSADGVLNGAHTAREIRSSPGTDWCIEFEGTVWSTTNGFYIQWDQTASNAVYIALSTGPSTAFVVSGAAYHVVHVWPPNVSPDPPPATDPPARPADVPDLPAGPDCPTASLESVCNQINDLAASIEHIFASLASATDQRAANQATTDSEIGDVITDVDAVHALLNTVHTDTVTIKADVEHLFPLVDDDLDASLGCPPADVTGKLIAFLPAALAAMNAPICGLRPHTAYTLGALTEFTGNLDLPDVDGLLLTLPALTPGDVVVGAETLYRYGLVAWGTADGLVPIDGSALEAPTWSTSVLLLAPSAIARRAYVHLFGNLTAHYQVVSYT